jgi:hypothetical protein
MSFLKPKPAKSVSENLNRNLITNTYTPTMQQGVGAGNFISSLLTGQGDTGAANAGYNNYLQQAGYAPAMRQLSQGITGQGAAAGILNSGSTAKALQTRGTELNQQFYNNYLQNLFGLSKNGLEAGNLIGNVGQKSTQTQSSPGLLGSLASGIGGIAGVLSGPATFGAGTVGAKIFGSDRRLKHHIRKVGEFVDGLGIYRFSYLGSNQRIKGVMADEVEQLRPWALGPKVAGYATVNYGAL